jgi:uncharacterized protein YtpQ (UPF0354 family)
VIHSEAKSRLEGCPVSAPLIVPVLTARIPVDLQLEFPLPPADAPIREPFVGDIYVSYVLDFTDRYEYVAPRRCAELGLAPESLREQGTANLRTRRAGLAMDWSAGAKAVSIRFRDDDPGERAVRPGRATLALDASLVLDDDLMDKLSQDVEGDLVVAMPARDVLMASGTAHQDGLAELRRTVQRVWATGEDRLISRDLLVRRRSEWAVLA